LNLSLFFDRKLVRNIGFLHQFSAKTWTFSWPSRGDGLRDRLVVVKIRIKKQNKKIFIASSLFFRWISLDSSELFFQMIFQLQLRIVEVEKNPKTKILILSKDNSVFNSPRLSHKFTNQHIFFHGILMIQWEID
jgi:hypothetical protein